MTVRHQPPPPRLDAAQRRDRRQLIALRRLCGWMVIFWTANLPPFIAGYFLFDYEKFVKLSLLYLGIVSIIALILGAGSWWQSLRVEIHQLEDADVQEVLDEIRTTESEQDGT